MKPDLAEPDAARLTEGRANPLARSRTWPLVVAVVLIAVYLRAPITGIGSLVNDIAADLGLSAAAAGMLTTLPLLGFAVVSLFASALADRLGAGYALLWGLAVALAGICARSLLGTFGLFLGTAAIGCGIAVGNVLLPAFIKKFFPRRIWAMTSLYTTVMTGMGGVSAAVGMPLAHAFGWRAALGVWAVACAAALVWWLPWRREKLDDGPRRGAEGGARRTKGGALGMARHKTAWLCGLYMGTQSLLFYCFVAWFSPVLQAGGMDAHTAGILNSLYLFIGVPGSLCVPFLERRFPSRGTLGAFLGCVYTAGMVCFAFAGNAACLAATMLCCGFCQGACISFAMAQFGIHAKTARGASALSAFGQSVGYLVAAAGPVLLGRLVDASGTWASSHAVLVAVAVVVAVLGCLVGRPSVVDAEDGSAPRA